MKQIKNKSEQLSFSQLLAKYTVQIPIIQRDYAQGRKSKTSLRDAFLIAIRNGIHCSPIELDFIYGDLKGQIFQPLDGQQRLTTLFLLHWYAAKLGQIDSSEYQYLSKFTYKTRTSSRDFCRDLIDSQMEITRDQLPSEVILDAKWYSLSWERDPTVKGMLETLDHISKLFRESENLWNDLIRLENPPITFHCVVLDDFGLSDDLYIKMNARGKPLTSFENFKAVLVRKIKKEKWDKHRQREEHFDILVDTSWTQLFWDKFEPQQFDDAILQFIANSLVFSLGLSAGNDSKKIRPLLEHFHATDVDDFNVDEYEYLYSSLQCFSQAPWSHLDAKFCWHRLLPDDASLFQIIGGKAPATFAQRLLFFAQTSFLLTAGQKFDSERYQDWMRVVRNIVRNASLDNYEAFLGAVSLIKEISQGCQNIYEFLSVAKIKSGFARDQAKEEERKASLIVADQDGFLKKTLHTLEDTFFCEGSLALPLRYAEDNKGGVDLTLLEEAQQVIENYFNTGITDQMRSALLTIGDGNYFRYWSSWLYATGCPKYRLIEDNDDLRRFLKSDYLAEYFVILFKQLLSKTPSQLIDDYESPEGSSTWRDLLISDPQLLSKARKKYFAFDDDWDHCYLIPGSKVAGDEAGRKKLFKVVSYDEVAI